LAWPLDWATKLKNMQFIYSSCIESNEYNFTEEDAEKLAELDAATGSEFAGYFGLIVIFFVILERIFQLLEN